MKRFQERNTLEEDKRNQVRDYLERKRMEESILDNSYQSNLKRQYIELRAKQRLTIESQLGTKNKLHKAYKLQSDNIEGLLSKISKCLHFHTHYIGSKEKMQSDDWHQKTKDRRYSSMIRLSEKDDLRNRAKNKDHDTQSYRIQTLENKIN